MKVFEKFIATVTISTDCPEDTDSILLEAAKELYKDGLLRISRKYDKETNRDRMYVEANLWTEKEQGPEEKTTTSDPGITNCQLTGNDLIEDNKNPNGIISKLSRFLGA